jgi:hypothetical protein
LGSLLIADEISALLGDEQITTNPDSHQRFSFTLQGLSRNLCADSIIPTDVDFVGMEYALLAKETLLDNNRVSVVNLADIPREQF